jgi:hypothetical protein
VVDAGEKPVGEDGQDGEECRHRPPKPHNETVAPLNAEHGNGELVGCSGDIGYADVGSFGPPEGGALGGRQVLQCDREEPDAYRYGYEEEGNTRRRDAVAQQFENAQQQNGRHGEESWHGLHAERITCVD